MSKASPTVLPSLEFPDRSAWQGWLEQNHDRSRGIWIIFVKKHAGKKKLSYLEAVEEAICYGWIDSLIKRLDGDRYQQKFTPRTDSEKWSALNRKRARKLFLEGRMKPDGLAVAGSWIERDDAGIAAMPAVPSGTIAPDLLRVLAENPKAHQAFQVLSAGQRRLCGRWIMDAKKEDTRRKRMAELISTLEQGKKLGMK